jgi:hypothetical protein
VSVSSSAASRQNCRREGPFARTDRGGTRRGDRDEVSRPRCNLGEGRLSQRTWAVAIHPSLAVARLGTAPAASATPARVLVGFTAVTDVPASTARVAGAVNYFPFVTASDDGGVSWSTPTIPAGAAPSDPSAAAGFLNDFHSEFVGDYSSASAAPDGKTFFYYSYTSTRSGSRCAAVDASAWASAHSRTSARRALRLSAT